MTSTTEQKLRTIYIIATIHSVAMFFWSFASNFLQGFLKNVETLAPGMGYVPFRLVSKYEGHTLAYVAHITPAMFWVLCVPLQFHPDVRRGFPRFHRFLGRAFVFTSCLMMVGVGVILRAGLGFDHFVNGGDGDANPWVAHTIPGTGHTYSDGYLFVVAALFLYTARMAVRCARAGDYANHKIWIIRHCSWGLWVMTQRFLVGLVVSICIVVYGVDGTFSGTGRFSTFFGASIAGIVLSVGTAEYAVWLIRKEAEASGGNKSSAAEITKRIPNKTPEKPKSSTTK